MDESGLQIGDAVYLKGTRRVGMTVTAICEDGTSLQFPDVIVGYFDQQDQIHFERIPQRALTKVPD